MPVIGSTAYGRARQRHNTLAGFTAANPVPADGEILTAYDGTDPVVKVGDGVRGWNALPAIGAGGGGGGGGIISQAIGFGSVNATEIVDVHSECHPNNWSFAPGDPVACGVEGGDFGWGYDEAGTYQVGINLFIGFSGGEPPFVTVELVTYWGDAWAWDVPCLPPHSIAGRSWHGVQTTLLTSWHWMPDKVETGTGQDANQLTLRWPGTDATLIKANGASANNSVTLYINRFGE